MSKRTNGKPSFPGPQWIIAGRSGAVVLLWFSVVCFGVRFSVAFHLARVHFVLVRFRLLGGRLLGNGFFGWSCVSVVF